MNKKQAQQSEAPAGARFDAFQVQETEDKTSDDKRSYWTKIGVAFPHNDRKGFNVVLHALPLDGKIVLRLHEAKPPEDQR
jgi:hypothetical protein